MRLLIRHRVTVLFESKIKKNKRSNSYFFLYFCQLAFRQRAPIYQVHGMVK